MLQGLFELRLSPADWTSAPNSSGLIQINCKWMSRTRYESGRVFPTNLVYFSLSRIFLRYSSITALTAPFGDLPRIPFLRVYSKGSLDVAHLQRQSAFRPPEGWHSALCPYANRRGDTLPKSLKWHFYAGASRLLERSKLFSTWQRVRAGSCSAFVFWPSVDPRRYIAAKYFASIKMLSSARRISD